MTEKPKWTEGEWHTNGQSVFGWEGSHRRTVCQLFLTNTTEANAHLLAASKKLYEALEAMTEHYVDLAGCGDCGHWNPEEEEQVINSRATLKQARGEAVERTEMPVEASVAPEGTQDTLERKEGFYWVRIQTFPGQWEVIYWNGDECIGCYESAIGFPDHGVEWGPRLEPPTFTDRA